MSEQTTETTATDAAGKDTDTTTEQPKATETVDYWKQRSRENEAKAKSNADAARKLNAIEEAAKTDAQKAADRLAAAEKDAVDAHREALKFKIAAKFAIGDEDADLFLSGSDEATLTKQAERLTARESERKKQGNYVPREGATSTAPEGDDRAAVRSLFGGGE